MGCHTVDSETDIQSLVADKVKCWSEETTVLAKFPESQLHATFSAFMHGLSSC